MNFINPTPARRAITGQPMALTEAIALPQKAYRPVAFSE